MQAFSATQPHGVGQLPPVASSHRGLQFAAVQLLLLVSSLALLPFVPSLPRELAGLHHYGPFLVFASAGAIAIAFNRGRVALAVASLSAAYALHSAGGLQSSPLKFSAVFIALPLMVAAIGAARERGIASLHTLRRAAELLAATAVMTWLVSNGGWAWVHRVAPALMAPAAGTALPAAALLAIGVALGVNIVSLKLRGGAIDASLVMVAGAVGVAGSLSYIPYAVGLAFGTAALGLMIGVLQDAHRFAFADELTGLGGRRAFNEKLLSLGDRFAIAMVDVDHFKRVNDRFGHDTGDQVLRMIAAHLAKVGGNARAYRFGGEEFAVVFPGKSVREAVPHLEALRTRIEDYRMQVRADDRPSHSDTGHVRRGQGARMASLQVTVSIGIAERDVRNSTADSVVLAADQALYRAKDRGRNRISR
ncbi:MAG: GGDEF domain-containing protein [Betaproteobacteria bacterium]|nr:GGDEF domain-containing protein [Betaproteobacteria bacterium]